jgi:pimeloyl-ACP methyl ester carboxylesterase
MPSIAANGITLEYDTFGAADAPPILLIMGLGAQMILWDEEFCTRLSERGYRVIRFDNRDVGRSTKLDALGLPDVAAAMMAAATRQPFAAPYLLADMAADAAGLLDGLNIRSAHVVGASMGGMIAQTLTIQHPERVRSLTSIMSSTGNPELPPPTPEAMSALMSPPPVDRAAAIEHAVFVFRTIGSPGFPFDEEFVRRRAALSYERGFNPPGVVRQFVAILSSGSRNEALRSLRTPTLVIHGVADPLVPIAAGRDTAAAIPDAEIIEIDGMGHDMPRPLWPRLIDGIANLAGRVEHGGDGLQRQVS